MLMPDMTMAAGVIAEPGQVELLSSAGATQSYVIPAGVTEVCMVLVGGPGTSGNAGPVAVISRPGTDLLRTDATIGSSGVGGGNGGARGANNGGYPQYDGNGGGGGAGGYGGNGGQGGQVGVNLATASQGGDGAGGAGGGGCGSYTYNSAFRTGQRGGPVGLRGQGANGSGGNLAVDGGGAVSAGWGLPGSNTGPLCGAGTANQYGGNLRWRNTIPVTPGETITVAFGYTGANDASGHQAGARIIWGAGRSYPSNAA